jgi:hypothetical protein
MPEVGLANADELAEFSTPTTQPLVYLQRIETPRLEARQLITGVRGCRFSQPPELSGAILNPMSRAQRFETGGLCSQLPPAGRQFAPHSTRAASDQGQDAVSDLR